MTERQKWWQCDGCKNAFPLVGDPARMRCPYCFDVTFRELLRSWFKHGF